MPRRDWSRRLPKPIDAGRRKLRTLHDVRAHLLKLPPERQNKAGYNHLAGILLDGAAGGDLDTVDAMFRLARMLHGE